MELELKLRGHIDKAKNTELAKYIFDHPSHLGSLINIFLGGDKQSCQNASMVIAKIADQSTDLLVPFIPRMIETLDQKPHDAIVRNVMRLLQHQQVQESHHGRLVKHCFNYLLDRNAAVAIQVFSMTVLANFCDQYPDLSNELKLIIEEMIKTGSPGIQSRGKKILNKLSHF